MNEKIITFKHFKSLVEYFKGKLSGKANNNHTHDDRYYTEAEMNAKLAGKSDSGHSHSAASQSAAGLMSAADKAKLDGITTGANKYTHPATSGNKHIPSGGASGQILRWGSDGTAVWGADNNTTYSNMGAATASAAGKTGLVPAPAAGAQGKYLRGDGTWQTPPNTTYSAATQSANGLMSAADKKKLDGIATGANKYTHPATSGNKHIPSGGASGQILRWGSDGTAVWGADNNTTYSNMGAATASAAGKTGLVPAPAAGAQGKYLRGDGTWQTPPNTTYSAATQSANGLMSAADKKKLDGLKSSGDSYSLVISDKSSGTSQVASLGASTFSNNPNTDFNEIAPNAAIGGGSIAIKKMYLNLVKNGTTVVSSIPLSVTDTSATITVSSGSIL